MKTLLPDETGYAHSSNEELNRLLNESEYRYVIKGHSHRRMVRRLDDVTFINAGTLLQKHGPGFCIIDFKKQQVQFFDFINLEIDPRDPITMP
jgi:predicted phosphodiesterase